MQMTRDELSEFQREAQAIVLSSALEWLRVTMPEYKDGAASAGWGDAVKSFKEFIERATEAAS